MLKQPWLNVALYEPEIPQNTGNIGRTCVALQARLWLIQPIGFRLDEKRLRRAGLDYWDRLDYQVAADWASLLEQLDPNAQVWLFTKHASRSYLQADFSPGDLLVFGSEARGLPQSLRTQYAEHNLAIPTPGPVRSLNLASAAAVAMYEAHRQIQP